MIGIVSFPGSNGDRDALHALRTDVGVPSRLIDHRETDLAGIDALVLPGGFSFGDALRCGAIARFAPVMEPLRAFAAHGGPILGICNGFQILTEAHLLPGAFRRNRTLRFHSHWTQIRLEGNETAWTTELAAGQVLRLPVAHGAGAFFAPEDELDRLEEGSQVVARYCDPRGNISQEFNPNGSYRAIAGITNTTHTIVGIMPHPERATDPLIGGDDGLLLLRALLDMTSVAA